MRSPHSFRKRALDHGQWRRAATRMVLALCALSSGSAGAWTLDALLSLPLERLMELRIKTHSVANGPLTMDADTAGAARRRNNGVGRAA